MFAFVVDGEFKGWWENEDGQEFYDLTCKKMGWNPTKTALYHYPRLKSDDVRNAVVDQNGKVTLRVKSHRQGSKEVSRTIGPKKDKDGKELPGEVEKEKKVIPYMEEYFLDVEEVSPVVYVTKTGKKSKKC